LEKIMLGRSRWEWFSGGQGIAGTVSGLLTMAMMVGLVFALVYTTDPDARLSTASAPSAPDTGATGGSTGEAGNQ
jgi:hypothetical protein